jgi:hypothetical protein
MVEAAEPDLQTVPEAAAVFLAEALEEQVVAVVEVWLVEQALEIQGLTNQTATINQTWTVL